MARGKQDIENEDDEAETETGAAARPKARLLSRKLVIIAAGVLLLALGAGGYLMMSAQKAAQNAAQIAAVKPPVFLDLPDMLVNLSAGSERTQYLKVKAVLELEDPTVLQQVQPMLPRVTDAFQTYLRELRSTDLDGSGGLYRLREELTRRVNLLVAPNRVNAILFKEIIIQ